MYRGDGIATVQWSVGLSPFSLAGRFGPLNPLGSKKSEKKKSKQSEVIIFCYSYVRIIQEKKRIAKSFNIQTQPLQTIFDYKVNNMINVALM